MTDDQSHFETFNFFFLVGFSFEKRKIMRLLKWRKNNKYHFLAASKVYGMYTLWQTYQFGDLESSKRLATLKSVKITASLNSNVWWFCFDILFVSELPKFSDPIFELLALIAKLLGNFTGTQTPLKKEKSLPFLYPVRGTR